MTRSPGRYLIYGLVDPRTRCLRYVGKTHKRRELRLREHIESAEEGEASPVYYWIRQMLDAGCEPAIFVLERVPGDGDWREAERRQIAFWRNPIAIEFPHDHPPQTPKSTTTRICSVDLTNVSDGG